MAASRRAASLPEARSAGLAAALFRGKGPTEPRWPPPGRTRATRRPPAMGEVEAPERVHQVRLAGEPARSSSTFTTGRDPRAPPVRLFIGVQHSSHQPRRAGRQPETGSSVDEASVTVVRATDGGRVLMPVAPQVSARSDAAEAVGGGRLVAPREGVSQILPAARRRGGRPGAGAAGWQEVRRCGPSSPSRRGAFPDRADARYDRQPGAGEMRLPQGELSGSRSGRPHPTTI